MASAEVGSRWRLLLALGVAGIALQMPLQAKPISGCLVQEADLLASDTCLLPPEQLSATRPSNQASLSAPSNAVARVTLENIDSRTGAAGRSEVQQSNFAECSALRGTHEAQSLMLQNIQAQLSTVENQRRMAKNQLNSMRVSGAESGQLTSAASRLTKINAVWSVLKGDVEKRTRSFNNSMTKLTKACLRG